jgi:selenocysteine lyase/cysteine desulfurase
VFSPLLDGLAALHGIQVWGPRTRDRRTPTVAFTITGKPPDEIATALARDRIATWAGHSYAVEVVDELGLADTGGVVRAGVVAYIEPDDVTRLLDAVEKLAATR